MNNLTKDSYPLRLLNYVRNKAPASFSLKDLRWAIEHHRCKVNGVVERFCSRKIYPHDVVTIDLIKRPCIKKESIHHYFQDEHLIVCEKPAQMTSEDLAHLMKSHLVHRLDRDTTGVILFAKTLQAKKGLEHLFRARLIKKEYLTLTHGIAQKPNGSILAALKKAGSREGEVYWAVTKGPEGLSSHTDWELLASASHVSFLRCTPLTGRTHQIRVHLASIGLPILGDVRYGTRRSTHNLPFFRPLLHAFRLNFHHPITKESLSFKSPLPEDFLTVLEKLEISYDQSFLKN